jgi:hypothetical protein
MTAAVLPPYSNGAGRVAYEEEVDEDEDLEPQGEVKRKPPLFRKTFSRGAVLKLRLENFL